MAQRCTVCFHPHRKEIEKALVSGIRRVGRPTNHLYDL
jgi:hypothetical protein